MQWSPMQDAALLAVKRWLDSGGDGVFRLFGYAGSGKTTLAKEFAEGLGGRIIYGAYTGKAAYVLQQKGCTGATTIHRLIYKPSEKDKTRLMELKKELEDHILTLQAEKLTEEQIEEDAQIKRIRAELKVEQEKHRRPSWVLNEESPVADATLVVIDECSMVDERIGRDLESFGVPILVLGDPAQLPPVRGAGYFTNAQPDVLLTEIHRQAKGNPILELATAVREGRGLRHGTYGDSRVIPWDRVEKDEVMSFEQVLVGTNKRRFNTNARMRQLHGRKDVLPEVGDRLVCLRNNHEVGLLNGGIWYVEERALIDDDLIDLNLKAEDSAMSVTVGAHTAYFRGEEPPFWDIKEHECFDYGYALTTHKAQGSQWDRVYIFDESYCFRGEAQRWLYTAITRAAKQVVVVTA